MILGRRFNKNENKKYFLWSKTIIKVFDKELDKEGYCNASGKQEVMFHPPLLNRQLGFSEFLDFVHNFRWGLQDINIKNRDRLIYIECLVSTLNNIIINRKFNLGPFFTNTPRIELLETKNIDLFTVITEKKKKNYRVSYRNFSNNIQCVYDFCFSGSMKDYHDRNFKFQDHFCLENK